MRWTAQLGEAMSLKGVIGMRRVMFALLAGFARLLRSLAASGEMSPMAHQRLGGEAEALQRDIQDSLDHARRHDQYQR
jgi:hypothetical protein